MNHCIILAGGLGTRLRSAVPDLPKCLAPVNGKPFLYWQMLELKRQGVTDFILSLGYGADKVLECIQKDFSDFKITVVLEDKPLGTGGALKNTFAQLRFEESLVINGDTYLNADLSRMMIPLHVNDNELIRIAVINMDNRFRYGGVQINKSKRITRFIEKGVSDSGLINAGVYRISKKIFAEATENVFSLETNCFPNFLSRSSISAEELSGYFIDIGIPDDYNKFCVLMSHKL